MPLINHAKKEINVKLVYVGPSSAGKATNLNYIYRKLKRGARGTFRSKNLQNDQMLFFDFIPSGQGSLNGYSIRFHVYTVTGEVSQTSSWKMVLKGADGLVFVADSDPARMAANVESLNDLQACLAAFGKDLHDIPGVVQCNKRDFPQATDPDELRRIVDREDYPVVPAVASRGEGVLETLFPLVKTILNNIRSGGLELKGEPELLPQIEEPAEQHLVVERAASQAAGDEGGGVEPVAPLQKVAPAAVVPCAASDAAADDELVVEVAGGPALLGPGRVRVPLAFRCGGNVKRMTLDISLVPDPDDSAPGR